MGFRNLAIHLVTHSPVAISNDILCAASIGLHDEPFLNSDEENIL